MAISAFWRGRCDLPAMLGPVTSHSRPGPPFALLPAEKIAAIGGEAAARSSAASAVSTTGCRPRTMRKRETGIDHGARIAGARRRGAPAPTATSITASASATRPSVGGRRHTRRRPANRTARVRAPAPGRRRCEMRLASSASSSVVKRTELAMVWRWRKAALAHQFVGVVRRDLDEIAEHGVVLDPQRGDAGFARDSAPPSPAMTRRLSSRSARTSSSGACAPGADESAVAREEGRLGNQKFGEAVGETGKAAQARSPARRARRPSSPVGGLERIGCGRKRAPRSRARRASPSRRLRRDRAGRRGRARAAPARARCRARARRVRAHARAESRLPRKNATASRRSAIAAGSVSGAARRAASSRAPAAVTVRSMAASRLPLRSPDERFGEFEIAPRRRVDRHARARRHSRRGGFSAGRRPFCVSSR